jgi:hypothetical protein
MLKTNGNPYILAAVALTAIAVVSGLRSIGVRPSDDLAMLSASPSYPAINIASVSGPLLLQVQG